MAANRRIGTLSAAAAVILFLNIGSSQPENCGRGAPDVRFISDTRYSLNARDVRSGS
jgi:hypothetical protein